MRIVIVGGGPAAVAAAIGAHEEAGQHAQRLHLVLCCEEPLAPYRRAALPRMLCGTFSDAQRFLKSPEFYRENQIEVVTHCPIVAVDRLAHRVMQTDGTLRYFDRLILATGAAPKRMDLQKSQSHVDGVMNFYTWEDAQKLRNLLQRSVAPRIVIVGGGVLGMELAGGLLAMLPDGEVRVVEALPCLLPRMLDRGSAERLQGNLLQETRFHLALGESVRQIISEARISGGRIQHYCTGVVLSSGQNWECNAVIFAVGAQPQSALAHDCLLTVRRGVVVSENLQSSDSAIFGAGDCAEFDCQCSSQVRTAERQGRIAGINAVRSLLHMPLEKFHWEAEPIRLQIGLQNVVSLGQVQLGESGSEWVKAGDAKHPQSEYRLFFDLNGLFCGAVIFNDPAAAVRLEAWKERHGTRAELMAANVV